MLEKKKILTAKQYNSFYSQLALKDNIPAIPNRSYKNKGWISWSDFLGTKNISNSLVSKKYLNYKEAKKIVHNLKFKSLSDYIKLSKNNKLPLGLPKFPSKRTYGDDWISVGDFIGTGRIADQYKKFVSFEEAKKIVKKIKISSCSHYNIISKNGKRPSMIPSNPQKEYKNDGWKGWPDFLGTGRKPGSKKV